MTPILVVPTMHGSMHNQILQESLRRLHDYGVTVVPPRQENGKNNLPDNEFLVGHLMRSLGAGTLKGHQLMITGGPTPVVGGSRPPVHESFHRRISYRNCQAGVG